MVKFVSNKIMKCFSFKKIVAVGLSCVMFFQCSSFSFANEMKNFVGERYYDKIENLVGRELNSQEIFKIKSEINILNKHSVYISMIDKIKVSNEGNEYKIGDEKVTVDENNNSITVVGENGVKNIVSFSEDGNLIVDGFEIQVNDVDVENKNVFNDNDEIENLVGNQLTNEEISKIKSEINVLNKHSVYISMIDKINISNEGNEYKIGDEKVTVDENNNSITVVGENGIKNIVLFSEDGNLIVDGFEIQVINSDNKNNGYKSTKSLYPYGKLKPSDYSNYLTSGQQDLVLGKAIENITYIVFHDILLKYTGFKDIIDSIADIARNIRSVLVGEDPKTEHVGCKFTTYTAGTDDYKYINKFYANKDCTGTYDEELSYEHFIVY